MGPRPSPFPKLRPVLVAALALALGCGGAWPSAADPGGGDHEGAHGGPALPGVPVLPGGGDHGGGGGDHGGRPATMVAPVGASSAGPVAPVIGPPIAGARGFGGGRGGDDGFDTRGRGDEDGVSDALEHARGRGRDAVREVEGRGRGRGDDGERGEVSDVAARAADEAVEALTEARAKAAQQLIVNHRDLIEPDNLGQPVVRGEVLALAPSPAALAKAQKAGFRIRSRDTLPDLGIETVVLMAPARVSAVAALARLRALDPQGQYDFNHVYERSGAVGGHVALAKAAAAPAPPARGGVRVGLVDGGVAAAAPALSGAHVVQRGFAAGGPRPSAHGTAVASLMAGRQGVFRGAAPGASLYVADVYGATPAGGSAEAIVRALGWLAQSGVPVINISLVGPPNLILGAAVKNLIARGHVLVAAVGNDGPAAPPLYPASYPGVVAVTAVDPRWRILPEAGRATQVDFAAPGSDMAAAGPDGQFVSVRGTSFAAPLAAGLLADLVRQPDRADAERAISLLGRRALDLGPRGRDKLYGRGLVGNEFRIAPGEVHARLALRGP